MTRDPLYRYIRLQMAQGKRPTERTSWRNAPPERTPIRLRIGRGLVRLGRWIEGQPAVVEPTTITAFQNGSTERP